MFHTCLAFLIIKKAALNLLLKGISPYDRVQGHMRTYWILRTVLGIIIERLQFHASLLYTSLHQGFKRDKVMVRYIKWPFEATCKRKWWLCKWSARECRRRTSKPRGPTSSFLRHIYLLSLAFSCQWFHGSCWSCQVCLQSNLPQHSFE